MRRPGAKFRDSEGDGKVTVVAAVIIVLLFAFAHHIGSQYSAQQGLERREVLERKYKSVEREHATCTDRTRSKATASKEVDQLMQKNDELRGQKTAIGTETEKLKADTDSCNAEISIAKERWEEDQERAKAALSEKVKEHEDLTTQVRVLAGKDARTKILVAAFRKFTKQHAALHSELGTPLELAADSPEYVDNMIQKWRRIDADATNKGEKGPLSTRADEVLPLEEDERAFQPVSQLDKYDPDIHATKIFMLEKDAEGKWRIPGWNGRQGTNAILKRGAAVEQIIPITTLNKNIRTLYKYALCAVGLNITGFMFPDQFKRCDTCTVEHMRKYIETPLVSFCDNCEPVHQLHAFKLLCNGYQDSIQYGGMLYWRSRSRIRFRDDILDAAKRYHDTLVADGAKVMSVVVPGSKPEDCKKTTLAFQKLLTKRGATFEEVSADHVERCQPPMGLIVETVEKYAKKIRNEHGSPVILISAPHWSETTFNDFIGHTKLFSFKKNIVRYTDTGPATSVDATDTMIAAWSDLIVVDRFSMKSVQVIENHLLLNSLKGKEIVVW